MSIADNIRKLKSELPSTVELVAVSKFKPVEAIREAYEAGQRSFGENRPQELAAKAPQLPADIVWHFIGHLQTNKVKLVVPYAHLIHSVDSERLLAEIDKAARAAGKVMDCLLEIHIAEEQTKQG
ncbi:MAG: alanine racemase, partial [Bacteroidales bacterium]|nr:alanine racemase [Bacteroidales bacterium]